MHFGYQYTPLWYTILHQKEFNVLKQYKPLYLLCIGMANTYTSMLALLPKCIFMTNITGC